MNQGRHSQGDLSCSLVSPPLSRPSRVLWHCLLGICHRIQLSVLPPGGNSAGLPGGSTDSATTRDPGSNSPILPTPSQNSDAPQGKKIQTPAPNVNTATPSTTSRPVEIKINPSTQVPRCATFDGKGDVPSGQTLWLVVFAPARESITPSR